jgi:peptidoglycan/xylan/chitin deacetylase (PgdA/CDA1 family)
MTHRSLTALTGGELADEVVASRAIVHRATGTPPEFFAYPYGHWNDRVRTAVRTAGYRAALALDPGLNGPGADQWALRRVNVPAGISDSAYTAWTASLPRGFSRSTRASSRGPSRSHPLASPDTPPPGQASRPGRQVQHASLEAPLREPR